MAATKTNVQSPFAGAVLDEEPRKWLPTLTELLDEQCSLCTGLEALSVRQSEVVGEGDTDSLLRILGERQVIIDRVGVVNAMLEPFRARKERVMARLSAPEREGVSRRVAAIGRLVESVQARDEIDRKLLETRRAGVAQELGGLSRGRGAVAAYSGVLGAGSQMRGGDLQG